MITRINSSELTTVADLTRMRNTLGLIPKLKWILVEEAFNHNQKILNFINKTYFTNTTYLLNTPNAALNDTSIQNDNDSKAYTNALNWIILNFNELGFNNSVIVFSRSSTAYSIEFFKEVGFYIFKRIIMKFKNYSPQTIID
jgi:hypothetical protein